MILLWYHYGKRELGVKLITRDTDYALRALCFIAKEKGRVVSAAELVKELEIPRPFLRKLLQTLHKKGILNACRGQGGGFSLKHPASRISLVDLIGVFQGPLKLNECLFKKLTCPNVKICMVKKKIDKIEKYVIQELKSIKLVSLLR